MSTAAADPAPAVTPPSSRSGSRSFRRILIYLLIGAIAVVLWLWQTGALRPRPRVALVTASSGPYWDSIVSGARDAADRYNLNLTVVRPKSDEPSQTESIKALLGKGFAGVAISPNDPPRQAATLAQIANETKLVTYDSDSPVAGKVCFIGTDNYDAGWNAGELVRQAVPGGGDVIIAIGSLDKENGQRRRQGVVDQLTDRSFEKMHPVDPIDATLKGSKYTIVATLVDGIDPEKATTMAADALKAHPNVKAFACLFAYNTPSVLKALAQANQLGKIQVVGFDGYEETLGGIEAGNVYATMMQSPYSIGFESVRVLGDIANGKKESLPMFSTFYFACDPVTKANVAEVRQDLAKKTHAPPTSRPAPGT